MASRKKSGNWSIGPGRALLYQGQTVAYVQRVESATTPTEADDLAHTVAAALNATGAGPRATFSGYGGGFGPAHICGAVSRTGAICQKTLGHGMGHKFPRKTTKRG